MSTPRDYSVEEITQRVRTAVDSGKRYDLNMIVHEFGVSLRDARAIHFGAVVRGRNDEQSFSKRYTPKTERGNC